MQLFLDLIWGFTLHLILKCYMVHLMEVKTEIQILYQRRNDFCIRSGELAPKCGLLKTDSGKRFMWSIGFEYGVYLCFTVVTQVYWLE